MTTLARAQKLSGTFKLALIAPDGHIQAIRGHGFADYDLVTLERQFSLLSEELARDCWVGNGGELP